MNRILTFLLILMLGILAGCGGVMVPVPGPLTRQEALSHYNANAEAIGAFNASITDWEVQFRDEDGKSKRHSDIGGRVFFVPSSVQDERDSFYLTASGLLGEAMLVGSNDSEYWMYIKPKKHGWWGKYEHRGKECSGGMLIDPQVFLEFAGLSGLPSGLPYPGYKVLAEENIIEYIDLAEDGFEIKREIIIDRRTNLAKEIIAYAESGEVIMRSRLSKYRQVGDGKVAGEIELSWPGRESFFRIKLRSLKKYKKIKRQLFERRESEGYEQVDRECDVGDGVD